MRTPITYYGGKQRMAKRIVSLMPEHHIYVEPFFGGGAVFWEKPKSYVEVINDWDGRVANFWKVCRDQFEELKHMVDHSPYDESAFVEAREILKDPDGDAVKRAWAFWYKVNMGFAGSLESGIKTCNGRQNSTFGKVLAGKREQFTHVIRDRLKYAQIMNRDALDLIRQRNKPNAFFYLDPPYPGAHQGHYGGYTLHDLANLVSLCTEIKGKFILSNYQQDIFRNVSELGWYQLEIDTPIYADNDGKRKTELLIANFPLPQHEQLNLFVA